MLQKGPWTGASCDAAIALARLRPTLTLKMGLTEEELEALTDCSDIDWEGSSSSSSDSEHEAHEGEGDGA